MPVIPRLSALAAIAAAFVRQLTGRVYG